MLIIANLTQLVTSKPSPQILTLFAPSPSRSQHSRSPMSAGFPGYSGGRTGVRVVVAGDRGTGKSSLIVTAASESFPENVPSVLPPTRLPADFFPDFVPLTIIDTSSRSVTVYVYVYASYIGMVYVY